MTYSIVYLSELIKENRWDAEFHRSIPFNKDIKYINIASILTYLQYGISIDMNEENKGYRIYRMNELENMFCKTHIGKYADIPKSKMEDFKLKDRDVLFNRTNSFQFVGRTAIFREFANEDIVFASYLIRMRTDETKILPEYLTTFLNTKYSIFDIKRRARISINQSNVSASELKKVKIPLIHLSIQNEIKNYFDQAHHAQSQAKQLYQHAETLLLQELGLLDYNIPQHMTFETTKKAVDQAGRFDAEYFQPK